MGICLSHGGGALQAVMLLTHLDLYGDIDLGQDISSGNGLVPCGIKPDL